MKMTRKAVMIGLIMPLRENVPAPAPQFRLCAYVTGLPKEAAEWRVTVRYVALWDRILRVGAKRNTLRLKKLGRIRIQVKLKTVKG